MDEFVRQAGAGGLTRVDLGTDTELSWGFYERYGFERVAAWPHHAYDYSLPGREVTAYIYSLDL
jgi:ribosomal protein S18 acetylase RimI-like enzyme